MRITSWNLGLTANKSQTATLLQEAARTLRPLDSDLILLQQVPDWQTCLDLTEALKPLEYQVLICSAFNGATPGSLAPPQVAILSKRKAYFTWSENGRASQATAPGYGTAFAAIEAGTRRLGIFTSLFGAQQTGTDLAQRLLAGMKSVEHWETNQVETFVVAASAGAFMSNPAKALRRATKSLEGAGLVDATEQLPEEARGTLRTVPGRSRDLGDCLFISGAGFPMNTRVVAAPLFAHYPLTCEVELDPERVGTAMDVRADNRRQHQLQTASTLRQIGTWTAGTITIVLIMISWRRSRVKRRERLARPTPSLLPARAAPSKASSPLRPVIFVEAPPKPSGATTSKPQSTLRLQKPSRHIPQDTPAQPQRPAQTEVQPPRDNPPSNPSAMESRVFGVSNATQTIAPEIRHGVIQELSGWLKQKLVRKLISDRAQMTEAQELATRMATTLDNRLARIEAQIQQQNQAYIRRIEDLNGELAAAREENRELIRERIAQVKAEMEAARARVLAEANLDNSSLRL